MNQKVRDWEEQQKASTYSPEGTAIILLNEYLEQIETLKDESKRENSGAFIEWHSGILSVLERTFGKDSSERTSFNKIRYQASSFVMMDGVDYTQDWIEDYHEGLDKAAGFLRGTIKLLVSMGLPTPQPIIKKSGTKITVNPSFVQDNHMKQQQEQSQTMTLEQNLDNLQRIVDTQLDDDEVEQVRELLENFKKKPGVWSYAKQLIVAGAGFGRDIAVQFIGSVLAAAALATK